MLLSRTILGLAAALCFALTPAFADSHGGHGHGSSPKTVSSSGKSTRPATTPRAQRPERPEHEAEHAEQEVEHEVEHEHQGRHRGPGRTTTTTTGLNPIAAKIASHPQLNQKVTTLLPAGMTLNQASAGFKNQGQFLAALNVSRNLNIPFVQLKADMVTNHLSLGQAIQDLRPTANATVAAHQAEHEAEIELEHNGTTTTTSQSGRTKRHGAN